MLRTRQVTDIGSKLLQPLFVERKIESAYQGIRIHQHELRAVIERAVHVAQVQPIQADAIENRLLPCEE